MCVGGRQSASLKGFDVLQTGRLRCEFIALVYVHADLLVKLLLIFKIDVKAAVSDFILLSVDVCLYLS